MIYSQNIYFCLGQSYDQYEDLIDFSNITLPISDLDIRLFEKQNPECGLQIFIHSDGYFYTQYSTKYKQGVSRRPKTINLVQNTTICVDTGELVSHFYPITNLTRFTQKIYNAKNPKSKTQYGKTIPCEQCAQTFSFKYEHNKNFKVEDGEIHKIGHSDADLTEKFLEHQFHCKKGIYIDIFIN